MAGLIKVRPRPYESTVSKVDIILKDKIGLDGKPVGLCHVCQQSAAYVCPRCRAKYCSAKCYKEHDGKCSEAFYKARVEEHVRLENLDDDHTKERRTAMLEVLSRARCQEFEERRKGKQAASQGDAKAGNDGAADDGIEEEDLAFVEEKLRELAVEGASSSGGEGLDLASLRPDELRVFMRVATAGGLSQLVKPWQPWWENASARFGIEELSENGKSAAGRDHVAEDSSDHDQGEDSSGDAGTDAELLGEECQQHSLTRLRCKIADLPYFTTLTSKEPSPLVPNLVVDVVFAYAYVMRLYNGCWCDDPMEAMSSLVAASPVLVRDARHESVAAALEACSDALRTANEATPDFISRLYADVRAILSDPRGGQCAFIDACALADASLAHVREHGALVTKDKPKHVIRQLELIRRRLNYFLLWLGKGGATECLAIANSVSRVMVERDMVT